MINYKTAKFRGVKFNFEAATTTGGRKAVIHNYPNSDIATSDDLGLVPKKFSLTAIITGIGDEYYTKRDSFLSALDTKGSGILSHPTFGDVTVVVPSYSLDENIKSSGKATISIVFQQVETSKISPFASNNKQQVANVAATTLARTEENLNEKLTANPNLNPSTDSSGIGSSGNKEDSDESLSAWEELVKEQKNKINGIDDDNSIIPDYSPSQTEINENAKENINLFDEAMNSAEIAYQKASDAGQYITSTLIAIDNYLTQPIKRLEAFYNLKGYIDVWSDFPYNDYFNLDFVRRDNNRKAYAVSTVCGATVMAIKAATEITYQSDVQLQTVQEIVNEMIEDALVYAEYDNDTLSNIKDAIVIFNNFIRETSVDVSKIKEIPTPNAGLLETVYAYYGDLTRFDLIIGINDIQEPSLIKTPINILTNER